MSNTWHSLFQSLPEIPSSEDIHQRALSLHIILKDSPDLLGHFVGQIFSEALRDPTRIDSLLKVFSKLAPLCQDESSITEAGLTGTSAVHKAFDIEILEASQTPGPPVDEAHPYDVSCTISSDEPIKAAVDRVIAFGKARRSWLIVHALHARSRALGVGGETEISPVELEQDFALQLIRFGVGLGGRGEVPDEANLIGALVLILGGGRSIRKASANPKQFDDIQRELELQLRIEKTFHLKYLIANALHTLSTEGEEWTSSKIFNEFFWIH